MANICSVCEHPKRLEIDRLIVRGANLNKLVKEYGLTMGSLSHHKRNHTSRQIKKAWELKQDQNGLDVLQELDDVVNTGKQILEGALEKDHNSLALDALKEIRGGLAEIAKIQAFIMQFAQKEALVMVEEPGGGRMSEEEEEELQQRIVKHLEPEEATVYFAVLKKLLEGGGERIPEIVYRGERKTSRPKYGHEEYVTPQPDPQGKANPLVPSNRTKRTKYPDEGDGGIRAGKPVESRPIPISSKKKRLRK